MDFEGWSSVRHSVAKGTGRRDSDVLADVGVGTIRRDCKDRSIG
jgi:hypothetical protein